MASNLVFAPLDKFKLSCFVLIIIMKINMVGWGLEGSKRLVLWRTKQQYWYVVLLLFIYVHQMVQKHKNFME